MSRSLSAVRSRGAAAVLGLAIALGGVSAALATPAAAQQQEPSSAANCVIEVWYEGHWIKVYDEECGS